jgi:hypothetical protein
MEIMVKISCGLIWWWLYNGYKSGEIQEKDKNIAAIAI